MAENLDPSTTQGTSMSDLAESAATKRGAEAAPAPVPPAEPVETVAPGEPVPAELDENKADDADEDVDHEEHDVLPEPLQKGIVVTD